MTETATRYTPKAGSLPHRVLTFMVLNPEEELTRADIATKFDANHSTIDSLLSLPVTRGVLKRGRNSDMDLVWSLGDCTDFVLDQSKTEDDRAEVRPARLIQYLTRERLRSRPRRRSSSTWRTSGFARA